MKCIILAAGYATRLYPLTENFPKPLLKVGGKAIIDWLVDDILSSRLVDEFVVVSNHRFAEHFRKWAAARPARRARLHRHSGNAGPSRPRAGGTQHTFRMSLYLHRQPHV